MNSTPFNILIALQGFRGAISVDQVADLLDKSIFTIYRMARKKQIPSLMIGGSRMFDPSTLALWLIKKEPQLAVAARQFKQAARLSLEEDSHNGSDSIRPMCFSGKL
jgi:excisionase family DNA binding protein